MAIATRQDAYIGGEWIPGDGEEIEVRSPATGELLGTVAASSPAQVDSAVQAAADAFPSWRKVSLLERVELCRAAFAICTERADEIAEMITREVGKTIRESREEMVEYTADHFRRASEDVLRHAGQVLPSTQERSNAKRIIVTQEPVGVVAAVTPWNFPVDIAGIPIVYGLAVGCTSVWKPSEHAPLCANMFAEVIHDAGFPAGTLNVVHGRGEVGSQLVRHPSATGSSATGSSAPGSSAIRTLAPSSSPAPRTPASRSPATRRSRAECSSWAGTGRRSSSPTPTSRRPPTPPSSAASTSPASVAPPRSASSCTSP